MSFRIACSVALLLISCATPPVHHLLHLSGGGPTRSAVLESPYRRTAHVYRGQLHAHSNRKGGRQSPARLVATYRDAGYDFIALTDHNLLTPDPRVPGILFIPGVENDHGCFHVNRIGATRSAAGTQLAQEVIDLGRRERAFVQINHPDWPGSYPTNPCWSDDALLAARDYDAMEVWNAGNPAKNRLSERRIDTVLASGRRTLLTATDDCHNVHAAYCMTSSVYVFADTLTADAIVEALKSGDFYASNGATISSISTHRTTITVSVPVPSDIAFIADGGWTPWIARNTSVATFEAGNVRLSVRIRVTRRDDGMMAWTNPIFVTHPTE